MFQKLATFLVNALDQQGALRRNSREIYIYGFDLLLYNIVSTLGLLAIGWVGGRPLETAVLITQYYTNQSFGGGYHAQTHIRCFVTMALGLLTALLFLNCVPCSISISVGISTVCAAFLWHFPLALHPNKAFLNKKALQLVRRSRRVLAVQVMLFALAFTLKLPSCIIQSMTAAFTLNALSRGTAVLMHPDLSFR